MISEIVRNIAIMALMTVFFEMMLPRGELQRFARVVTGLLLLLAILSPILNAFTKEKILPAVTSSETKSSTGILQAGEDLKEKLSQDAIGEYQETLGGQIAALAGLAPGAEDVTAQTELEEDGSLSRVTLTVSCGAKVDQEVLKEKISELLINFYTLKQEQLNLIIIAGKDDENG